MKILPTAFLLATFAAIFGMALAPKLHLFAYAPFLVLAYRHTKLLTSLWLAFICGLIVDLFSSTPFGLTALNYCMITGLLYRQKWLFFDDKPINMSLFTALLSISSSLLGFILLFIFGKAVAFHGKLLITDLIFMPIIDGIYAFVWFSCPILFVSLIKQTWRRFYINRKRR